MKSLVQNMRATSSRIICLAQSPKWFWVFVIATLISVLIYLINAVFFEVNPGNIWGLTYGTVALILMIGVALYAVRRRKMRLFSRFGHSFTWVQYHVYGGSLFLLWVFMHSAFTLPSGPLNWWMWILSVWVTISGIFGVFLQKWIPRILASGLSVEVVYERIPELVREIRERSEELIKTCAEPVRDLYMNNLYSALLAPKTRWIYYIDITGGIKSTEKQFEYIRNILTGEEAQKLVRLESMYKTKLELDAHYTLQKLLRWWLYSHVPLSIVLLILVAIHLFAVFYY